MYSPCASLDFKHISNGWCGRQVFIGYMCFSGFELVLNGRFTATCGPGVCVCPLEFRAILECVADQEVSFLCESLDFCLFFEP